MRGSTWDNVDQLSTSARILRYIFRNAPASRAGMVKDLSLSPAMVTTLTSALIAQGIVEDLGETAEKKSGTSGRKRLLIGIRRDARCSVGVEIGVRHFRFCLTDLAGRELEQLCYVPGDAQIAHVNASIAEGVRRLVGSSGVSPERIVGVGVALPGHLNPHSGGMVTHARIWDDFNAHALAAELGLPVAAENNVRAMAYQKYLFDAADCPENFVLIHVGAGIFCANFTDGRLVEGSYIAGEIGHTVANPDGCRCECGKNGCLQTYASESWLVQKAKAVYRAAPRSALRALVSGEDGITLDTVLTAYELGDDLVVRVVQEAVKYLGVAVANLAIIMSPQKIYLHSRMFQNELLRGELRGFIESQLKFVENAETEEISILDFEPSRAANGAAALAIDRLFIRRTP